VGPIALSTTIDVQNTAYNMKATHANKFPEKRKASESLIGHDEKKPKSEDNAEHVFAAM
jgi:hypothetical protein